MNNTRIIYISALALLIFAGLKVFSVEELQPNLIPLAAKDLRIENLSDGRVKVLR